MIKGLAMLENQVASVKLVNAEAGLRWDKMDVMTGYYMGTREAWTYAWIEHGEQRQVTWGCRMADESFEDKTISEKAT
jgi:hypothetical protein